MKDEYFSSAQQDTPFWRGSSALPCDTFGADLTLSPAAVLPEQFFSLPHNHYKGEAALMYAVLEDAFNCFAKQFVENELCTQRLAQEAEEWFFSDDERWPFSFVNVCVVLGINAEYVRWGLKQWRQKRPAPRSLYLRTVA